MCRNIIIALLIIVIFLGAGCAIFIVRYNRLADRASEQAERIGGLAKDVNDYRERIAGITGELEDERKRAEEVGNRLRNLTAENNRLANTLDTITRGIVEGGKGVERITESEKRTADIYLELENYLNSFLIGGSDRIID